ncbi:MAG: outer membrane beta-barrel protein [Acidobacteriota bacterium]
MHRPWKAVALAAALNLSAAGMAAAQTVLVRNVPAGSAVDAVLNATTTGSGAADADGVATLPLKMKETIGKAEIDANVFVDSCDNRHRIIVVELGGALAAPEPDCRRQQISGLYWVRPVNTIVVNLAGAAPSLLLIKGGYGIPPPGTEGENADSGPRTWRQAPNGLVIGGGAGLSSFRDAKTIACGTVSPCGGRDSGIGYTAGATFWIKRFLGVEGAYLKPRNMTASGGDSFKFDSEVDADIWTLAGIVAAPIGPVRLYGKGGMTYHQATATTKETIGTASQTFDYRTKGYGWMFGAGLEAWVTSRVALFTEAGVDRLKGKSDGGGAPEIDDRMRTVIAGLRIHIGR